jgi:SAM-dependent methyltransferase
VSTTEIRQYYDSTKNSDVRSDLSYAVSLIGNERIAIDCGCGAGSGIAFLRENSFTVYAFDIEEESILLCNERFKNDNEVLLFQEGFSSFVYPKASLIVADASLFFCPPHEFEAVWNNISQSLMPDNGIFCGSFLGPNDTMAGPNYDENSFWPDVMVFTEEKLRENFTGYEILKWTEHKISGETPQGKPHNWHIFSVVAKNLTRP